MKIAKISDIGKEVVAKNDDVVLNAISMIQNGITNISERQLEFENKTTDAYNKLAQRVIDIANEKSQSNPVAQSPTNPPAMQETSSQNDKDGVNWGGIRQDEFAGQKVAMKKPNADQNVLAKIGLDSESAALIINKIIDGILQKNTGNMGGIMQEFMIRDFFENYQRGKLYEKANLNMLMKRGLLAEEDVKPVLENSNTLQDPINQKIQAMRNPQGVVKK